MFRRLIPALTAGSLVIGVLAFAGSPAYAEALEAPGGLSIAADGGDLALKWQRLDGASAYHLQIATETSTPTLVKDIVTYAPTYVVADALGTGELHWRVAAFGSSTSASTQGAWSDWQDLTSNTLAAPATSGPGSTNPDTPATITYPTGVSFAWSPVPGAASYTVQYATDPEFKTGVETSSPLTSTSFTPKDPLTRSDSGVDVVWHWRVRADFASRTTDSGTWSTKPGRYSDARAFRVTWPTKPTLITPVGTNPVFSDLRFTWSSVPGAAKYRIEVGTGRDTGADQITALLEDMPFEVYGTTWVPETTLLDTNYFWRVTPVDGAGNLGTKSAIAQFRKHWGAQLEESAPDSTPIAFPVPGQGTNSHLAPEEIPLQDFELSWSLVARATLYELEVASLDDGNPSTNEVVLTCRTASTSATVIQKVVEGTGYANTLQGAKTCLYQSTTASLAAGRTYRWKVRAVDYSGAEGTALGSNTPDGTLTSAWSDEMSTKKYIKVIDSTTTPTDELDLDEAAWATQTTSDLLGQPAPLFSWEPYTDGAITAGGYEVEIALNDAFTTQVAKVLTRSTRLRLNGVFADNRTSQPYAWRIRAVKDPSASTLVYMNGSDASLEKLKWQRQATASDVVGVTPVTTLEDGTTRLAWRPQAASAPKDGGSRGYQITISSVSGASSGTVGVKKVEYPFYAAKNPGTGKPLAPGSYTFSVAALDANGNAGVSSDPEPFTIAPPAPTSLNSTVASSSVALRWTPVAAAASYVVTYGLPGGTTTSVASTQTSVSIADLATGTYNWSVRSKDVAGHQSAVTATQSFTVRTAAPAITLTAGAVLDLSSQRLTWSEAPGASRYLVRIGTTNPPTAVVAETSATTFVPTQALSYGTQYYWNVSAVYEKVTTSTTRSLLGSSPVRDFYVVTAPTGSIIVGTPSVVGTTATISWPPLTPAQRGTPSAQYALTYDVRYRALAEDGSPNAWFNDTGVVDSLSYQAKGLQIDTKYEIQLRARTSLGAGPWSLSKTFTTPTKPGVVRNAITSVSSSGLKVSWAAPSSNGGSEITGYVVAYRLAGGSWTTLPTTTSTYVVPTGLTGGATYEITIKAKNMVGTGSAATLIATGVSAPGAPSSVKAVRGNASATVSWAAPSNTGGTAITGYIVQLRFYGTSWSTWTTKVNAAATARSTSITGLVNGRKYQARVMAKNALASAGGAPSAAYSFAPATKPSTPTVKGLVYTGKIKVSWVKPALNGSTLTGYKVYRSYDKKTWTLIKTATSTTLSYTWTGPVKGKRYYFGVLATSNVGDSAKGSTILLTAK